MSSPVSFLALSRARMPQAAEQDLWEKTYCSPSGAAAPRTHTTKPKTVPSCLLSNGPILLCRGRITPYVCSGPPFLTLGSHEVAVSRAHSPGPSCQKKGEEFDSQAQTISSQRSRSYKDSAITGPCHDPIGVTIHRGRWLVVTLAVLRALTSY